MAHGLIGPALLVDFHQKSFHHKFLHAAGLPEHPFGVNVEMKVARLDGAESAGFFRGFALGGLAVREARFRRSLGEGPLISAVGVDQQELHRGAALAVTDCGHLQRQRLRNARRTHGRPPATMLLARYFKDVNMQQKLCRQELRWLLLNNLMPED